MQQIYPGIWKISFGEPEKIIPKEIAFSNPSVEGLKNLPTKGISPFEKNDVKFKVTTRGCTL